jgi:2-polyprenyl-6-methoxyphenol hydroxylase-like FAD-dependent oxidoreductase
LDGPWIAAARRLGVVNDLLAAGGHQVPFFNVYFMGTQTEHRPFPTTTPAGEAALNMYHPDLQETLLKGAANAGAEVRRGIHVQSITEQKAGWVVTFGNDNQTHSVSARLVVGADGRFSSMRQMPAPGKRGLALIGDAAGATDPSWGCGLSKTLVDVETLAGKLAATDDWDSALQRYAAMHDDYFGKLHDILSWWTTLVWTGGPEADDRRARVFPRMHQDPTGFPDPAGQGPFGPSDERARRLLLGEGYPLQAVAQGAVATPQ